MFRELKGNFKIIANGRTFDVSVERVKSGAFDYGDGSAHVVQFNGDDMLFDTRYDCIPTDVKPWLNWWTDWFRERYKAEVISAKGEIC